MDHSDGEGRLAGLATMCRKARKGRKHPRYDEATQALARALVAGGMPIKTVAQGAGISDGAIRKWMKVASASAPVRVLEVKEPTGVGGERDVVLLLKTKDYELAVYRPGGGPACFP